MPYVFEQGVVLSVIDDYLSDQTRAVAALKALRPQANGALLPVSQAGGFDAVKLQAIPDPLDPKVPMSAAQHLEQHWFNNPPGTAWWKGWSGDAEGIVRWTLISALEVSLGIDHVGPGQPPVTGEVVPSRFWRIHLHWACGSPLFQGWVGWHKHGPGQSSGIVTVVFTTPGIGKPMFATPHDPYNGGTHPRNHQDPAKTIGNHGLWVIGQDKTRWVRSPTLSVRLGAPVGTGLLPAYHGLKLETHGDVCIVAPSEASGGVLADGRTYEASNA